MNKAYLVYRDLGYGNITLVDSKLFINKLDAQRYMMELDEFGLYGDIKIKEMELN